MRLQSTEQRRGILQRPSTAGPRADGSPNKDGQALLCAVIQLLPFDRFFLEAVFLKIGLINP